MPLLVRHRCAATGARVLCRPRRDARRACEPRDGRCQHGVQQVRLAVAARIVFALSPNSASCERVFALLKRMYSEEQLSSLADAISTSLMLAYNARRIG